MKYPVNKEKWLAACQRELGPVDEKLQELFSLYIGEINRAYKEGYDRGCVSKETEAAGYIAALQAFAQTDVVEVVRCGNCTFCSPDTSVCRQTGYIVPNLHYCSYGEWRADDE